MIIRLITMFFVFVTQLCSSNAFSGDERGNGGDVVKCSALEPGDPGYDQISRTGSETLVLDYLEATERGFKYDLPASLGPNTYENRIPILNEFIHRIAKFSPNRAALYSSWLKSFFAESRFTVNNLVDIPDSNHLSMPIKCHIVQAIIQTEPMFPEDRRYLIDSKIGWSLRFPEGQCSIGAGLMLHEIVYREAMKLGQTNSIKARYFHSYVASTKFHDLTIETWKDLIKITGLDQNLN